MLHDTVIPIGTGGIGGVFKAWDPNLEHHDALKYLRHDDPVLVERLLREARTNASVSESLRNSSDELPWSSPGRR